MLDGDLLAAVHVDAPFALADGFAHTRWVDYDARSRTLSVFLSRDADAVKPAQPALQREIDLARVVDSAKLCLGSPPPTAQRPPPTKSTTGASWAAACLALALGSEGHLVLNGLDLKPIWKSGNTGPGGTSAALGNDGVLVLSRADGTAVWRSTGTPPAGLAAQQ